MQEQPFADLPDALVKDLLNAALPVGEKVSSRFASLRQSKAKYRQDALAAGLIQRKADLDVPREPSVVGIDGSYQLHRLTSLDLCAAAAVAVEGTSKEAQRHWPEPYHRMWVGDVPHKDSTVSVLRGLMVGMELELAAWAPHDLALLDGSFGSLIIYLNQGLSSVANVSADLGGILRRRWQEKSIFNRLLDLLRSDRALAVPKFTTRNELAAPLGVAREELDGRTLATLFLEPGEYTRPLEIYPAGEDFHLPRAFCSERKELELNRAMRSIRVVYYRPFGWTPAVRLELPGAVANSLTRLSLALEGIYRQFFSPAALEPYPLFIADRMVKSLGAGVNVVEQTVAQQVVDQGQDIELKMLLLQNYRTEGGRGGV